MQYKLEDDDCVVSISELDELVDGLDNAHMSLLTAIKESSDKSLLEKVSYDLKQIKNYADYWRP